VSRPSKELYGESFYRSIASPARRSAEVLVPALQELLAPRSVLDVGCGTGQWLTQFQACGVEDVQGVDAPWIDEVELEISPEKVRSCDLSTPLDLGRCFDLAISLEVAEHLPESAAGGFVESLVRHAEVVLFSAAIPGQGGEGHLNERWPAYWFELFARHGYRGFDCLRERFWLDDRVAWWYRQNSFLFLSEEAIEAHGPLPGETTEPMRLVHPELYAAVKGRMDKIDASLPGRVYLALRRRLRGQ